MIKKFFDEDTINRVWLKGFVDSRYNSNIYRKDIYGAFMQRDKYGDVNCIFGWEVDHIFPVSKGGTDNMANLQPLSWQNNRAKGDRII